MLIDELRNSDAYPHAVTEISVIETHISWIILTGDYAYKIKKPVDFGFLDYSTLVKRKHFCELELSLNRRFSEELYLDVVSINECRSGPRINGAGKVLEYAVQMREFPQDHILSNYLKTQPLPPEYLVQLAKNLSDFHTQGKNTEQRQLAHGAAACIRQDALDNFKVLHSYARQHNDNLQKKQLRDWTEQQCAELQTIFAERKQEGHIRECHGDLHLGNIILLQEKIVFFDCIEFNEAFRWIDTMSELAFLLMDFESIGLNAEANRLLNEYLSFSGDYEGLHVLSFYKTYRALVRAKVNTLRLQEMDSNQSGYATCNKNVDHYLDLAQRYAKSKQVFLAITHGVSGTGKTTIARQIAQQTGAIHIRSDVERKRMFGLKPEDSSQEQLAKNIYTTSISKQTYDRLFKIAKMVLDCQLPVIVDATFLTSTERNRFRQLGEEIEVPFVIIDCQAKQETLVERLEQRRMYSSDPSEADSQVMLQQLANAEPLGDTEKTCSLRVNTEGKFNIAELQTEIAGAVIYNKDA